MAAPTVMSVLVLGGGILTLAVAVEALRKRPNPLATPITILCVGAGIWSLPIGLGFHTDALAHHLWLTRIRYVGTVTVPLAYYVVAFRYAGHQRLVRRRVLIVLASVPAITLILVWTSGYHALFWDAFEVEQISGVYLAQFSHGPWFWVNLVWSYGLILAGFSGLLWEMISVGEMYRQQATVVFIGGAVPFTLNAAYYLGIDMLAEIDLTPIGIGIGGTILAIGLLLFDLVEIRPIARQRLLEQLRDGVIVVDPGGRLREANPVAEQILDDWDIDREGQVPAELEQEGREIEAIVDGVERYFRIEPREFYDSSGGVAGRLLYLNDITEIARREQRISVLHRVLRHNIRNEMTILLGHLEYAQRDSDPEIEENLVSIERSAKRIMSFAENARLIERTLKRGEGTEPVDVVDVVHGAVDLVARRVTSEGIETQLDAIPTDTRLVSVIDRELIQRAIAELIENAIEHGEAPVRVRLCHRQLWMDVEIIDDGSGIPDGEIEALDASVETALAHGSGLGLWVARWSAELSGGELRFEHDAERNVVCMRLPIEADVL